VGAVPVADGDGATIGLLVAALGDPDYAARENAAARLVSLGDAAADALLTAAETTRDVEVALRSRWLVESLPVELADPADPPAAAALLHQLRSGSEPDRLRTLLRLLRLDDDAGIAPLARVARRERSMSVSRFAARLLVREWLPDDPFWPRLGSRITSGIGSSERPAARFLGALVAYAAADTERERQQQAAAAEAALDQLAGTAAPDPAAPGGAEPGEDEDLAEVALVVAGNGETVRDLRRCLCAMQVAAGQRERALEQAARLFDLDRDRDEPSRSRDERLPANVAAIAEDLVWLADRGLPEAVNLLERRWPGLEIDEPLTAYAAAVALAAAGDRRRADAVAGSAREGLRRADFEARFRMARRLVRWGAVDWAVAEYDAFLADDNLPVQYFASASIISAEFLHDQGRDDRAAAVLEAFIAGRPGRVGEEPERVLPALDRDPRSVTSRMLYFKACAAGSRGDAADQRRLLEESLQAYARDVDSLIGLYQLPGASPQERSAAQALIGKALARIDEEIQALPEDPNGYNEYAWLVSNTEGDVAKAIRYSRLSLDKMFDSPSYLDTLAHCHAAAGDLARAVRTQALARRFEPHNRTIERNLARFRARLGE